MTVVFATRASLAEATDVVDVLHLVGARDGYIAMQFARRAAWQSLRGGFVGVALLVPALAIIVWLGRQIDPGILPEVTLPWTALAGLAFLPLAAMMLSALTAHVTVRRNLATVI
jgi:cell division transport system permease protein